MISGKTTRRYPGKGEDLPDSHQSCRSPDIHPIVWIRTARGNLLERQPAQACLRGIGVYDSVAILNFISKLFLIVLMRHSERPVQSERKQATAASHISRGHTRGLS
jgi:hypothetical protein